MLNDFAEDQTRAGFSPPAGPVVARARAVEAPRVGPAELAAVLGLLLLVILL